MGEKKTTRRLISKSSQHNKQTKAERDQRTFKIIDSSSKDEIFDYFAKNNEERKAVDLVMEQYPVRITSFLKTLLDRSEAIRRQYLPSPKELATVGIPTPFEEGKEASKTYGLERVYRDRVLLTPHSTVPLIAVFATRKAV